ncbi:mechanosensitive ion channel family protein [Patescibacteria group bacterium]
MPYFEFLQYSYFGNTLERYLLAIGIFVLFIFGAVILNFLVKRVFQKYAIKTKTKLDDTVLHIFQRVVVYILALAGLYFGIKALVLPDNYADFLNKAFQVILIFKVFQGITILSDFVIKTYFCKLLKSQGGFEIQLTRLISRIANIALWVIGLSMILQVFDYNITALVTGLGIGGLAIALAAQDTLGNFFSSLAIMTDKPYKIGDIVKFADYEGFIRDIGLRTTRIETFKGTFISVPNSELAKSAVENLSKMRARRYDGAIGLAYDTKTAKIKKALALMRAMIKEDKSTTSEFRVHFTDYDESSLRIEYTYFVKKPEDYEFYMKTRTKLNIAIKDALEKEGIEMAFPTRTVHLINES